MSSLAGKVTPQSAPGLAQKFVDFAMSIDGVILDYSVSSLSQVDDIIEGMRRSGLKTMDVSLNLLIAGCYVGEVLVRSLHLNWVPTRKSSYVDFPSEVPIVVQYGPHSFTSPIDKVIKRLENGKEDYLPFYYQVLSKIVEEPPNRQ